MSDTDNTDDEERPLHLGKQTMHQLDAEIHENRKKLDELKKVLAVEEEISKNREKLEALQKVLAEEQNKTDSAAKKVEAKGKDVAALAAKLEAEQQRLEQIKKNENMAGGPTEKMQEQLVQDMLKKLNNLVAAKRKLEKRQKKREHHEEIAQQKITRVKDTLQKALKSKQHLHKVFSKKAHVHTDKMTTIVPKPEPEKTKQPKPKPAVHKSLVHMLNARRKGPKRRRLTHPPADAPLWPPVARSWD